jgi:hypothetical protein
VAGRRASGRLPQAGRAREGQPSDITTPHIVRRNATPECGHDRPYISTNGIRLARERLACAEHVILTTGQAVGRKVRTR